MRGEGGRRQLWLLGCVATLTASSCAGNRDVLELRDLLGSAEASQVVSAVNQLLHEHGEPLELLLENIPDEHLAHHVWFANVAIELEKFGSIDDWPSEVRPGLSARVSEAKGVAPPPSAQADEALNARIHLEGGRFNMENAYPVTLSPFVIQEHEVTNREYRRFAPKHDIEAPSDHPVRLVNWYDAMAYAAWLGGSLPTEAQWELAARGTEGRTYPWGEEAPTPERASYGGADGSTPAPVKTYPGGATPEGVYDLAGNLFEWCRDWHGIRGDDPTDPLGPEQGLTRSIRGGSFRDPASYIRSLIHTQARPEDRIPRVGFRVAWSEAAAGAARAGR